MILFGYEPLLWYWSMPDYMWQHISFRSLGMGWRSNFCRAIRSFFSTIPE